MGAFVIFFGPCKCLEVFSTFFELFFALLIAFFVIFLCMAHTKQTAKLGKDYEADLNAEETKSQHSGDDKDLSQVDADPTDLVGLEKCQTTVHFRASLVTPSLINF